MGAYPNEQHLRLSLCRRQSYQVVLTGYTWSMPEKQRVVTVREHTYPYTIRKSKRARHLLLHTSLDKGIEVVVPWRTSYRAGEQFVRSRTAWLAKQLARLDDMRVHVPQRQLTSGEKIPLFGDVLILKIIYEPDRQRSRVRRDGALVVVHTAQDVVVRPALERWYRHEARHFFIDATKKMAQQSGVSPPSVRINSARSQWGSCSGRDVVSFTWRLALAPEFAARYVAAHELAHLTHRKHTAAFWQVVEELLPHYTKAQIWLKKHGYTLAL